MPRPILTVPGYVLDGPAQPGQRGGMAARRLADDWPCCLRLLPAGAQGPVASMARITGWVSVRQRGLLGVHDVVPVRLPDEIGSLLAVAVDRAPGPTLATLLQEGRQALSTGQTVAVAGPVAAVVAGLHRAGVVHGAVGPTEVSVTADGGPVVSDLAAAAQRLADRAATSADPSSRLLLAPELFDEAAPGPEADVYGWGIVAWSCRQGGLPTRDQIERWRAGLDGTDPLDALIDRCLALEPADRPVTSELVSALRDCPSQVWEPRPGLVVGRRRWPRGRGVLPQRRRPGGRARPAGTASVGARRPVHPRAVPAEAVDSRGAGEVSASLAVVATMVVALVVLGVWGLAGVLLGGVGGAAQGPTSTGQGPAGAGAPVPTAVEAPEAVSTDAATTPPDNWGEEPDVLTAPVPVLQSLLDARSSAWREGDARLLEHAFVVGGAGWEADQAGMERAAHLGVTYLDLEFVVHRAAVVDDSTSGVVLLEAEVQRPRYQVTWPSGQKGVQQEDLEQVTLELRRAEGGWRIWAWS